MELKNIIQLKDGYRVGFDITDEDFSERTTGLFNSGTQYKTLKLNQFKLELLIKDKVVNEMEVNNIEIVITDINYNVFNGYAYFNVQPFGTRLKDIFKKYGLKEVLTW